MKKRKIGVMIESFQLGVKRGIQKAAELGADGFQIFVTEGEMAPEALSASGRAAFRKFVDDQGLVISALCADYFRGFLDPAKNDETIAMTKASLDLAVDLGTNVVTSHIGTLPADEKDVKWKAGLQAITEVARYGASKGVWFASETGPESGEHLRRFLDQIPGRVAKANFDPANLVMNGFDHLAAVKELKPYIVHTHAKDGLKDVMKEVPLGEGAVDFPKYVALLDEIGYDGFLTIEREVGDDPVGDITKAVRFLRAL